MTSRLKIIIFFNVAVLTFPQDSKTFSNCSLTRFNVHLLGNTIFELRTCKIQEYFARKTEKQNNIISAILCGS